MTYSPTIPQAADLLSQSQLDIQTNFSQANTIMGANHVNFDNSLPVIATLGYLTAAADEGKHTIITQKRLNFGVVAPVIAANDSCIFSQEAGDYTGVPASGGRTESFFKNGSGQVIHFSPIKAWAYCRGTAAAPAGTRMIAFQSYNIANVTRTGVGDFTVDLTPGTLLNANYAVLITSTVVAGGTNCVVCNYSIVDANQFTLRTIDPITNSVKDVNSFSFIVLQIGRLV